MAKDNPNKLAHALSHVKAVAFDAVGTLIFAEPSVVSIYCQLLAETTGLPIDPMRVRDVLTIRLADRTDGDSLTTSEEQERAFWFDLISELVDDVRNRKPAFERLFSYFSEPKNWRCFEHVAETLHHLKLSGKRLLLASNFDQRLHVIKAGLNDLNDIDHVIVSSEVGWRKPSTEFFQSVCRVAGCRPEEILFVGDDMTADIHGSSASGLHAVWVNRAGKGITQGSCPDGAYEIRQLSELVGFA